MKLDYVCSRCDKEFIFGTTNVAHLPGGVRVEWCPACLTAWAAYSLASPKWLAYSESFANLMHYQAGGSSDTPTQELVSRYRDAEVAMAGLAATFGKLS